MPEPTPERRPCLPTEPSVKRRVGGPAGLRGSPLAAGEVFL